MEFVLLSFSKLLQVFFPCFSFPIPICFPNCTVLEPLACGPALELL